MTVLRVVLAVVLVWAVAPVQPAAQQGPEDPDALAAEFLGLMNEGKRGFVASDAVLSRAFAAHLRGEGAAGSVAELSARRAAYDPLADSGFTAGMLYFYLARPVAVLRELGGGPNEVFSQIIEIRLRWLSGATDLALQQAEVLIGQMDQQGAGWSDPEMTSLLADAAVLSWRAGKTEQAERFFTRARVCAEPRCPADLVFGWLGEKRTPSDAPYDAYDPEALAGQAGTDAGVLFPGDQEVQEEIRREALFMSGRYRALLAKAVSLALSGSDPADLPGPERRRSGQLALRVMGATDFSSYLMTTDSVAGQMRMVALSHGEAPAKAPAEVAYLDPQAGYADLLLRELPLVQLLLGLSDRRGDDVVAELIRIRLLLSAGELDRAGQALARLAGSASARGFSGRELASVLFDQWAVAVLSGQQALAERLERETASCRTDPCDEDIVLAAFERGRALPRVARNSDLREVLFQAADPVLRQLFPGDQLKLADLYDTGAAGGQSRPMDAARYDLLSISFAETAPDIAPGDLARRAARVMHTLVYAGQYAAAADLGDRIAARLKTAGQGAALSYGFYQYRARAAFWQDDARAEAFYARAVDLALTDLASGAVQPHHLASLALDLADTAFLGIQDQLLSAGVGDPGLLARLRFRQGRPEEAADILSAQRRQAEQATGERMSAFFQAIAARHLRNRQLDRYVEAWQRARAAAEGTGIPPDHHHNYRYFWDLKALAYQEAVYRDAAGQTARAAALRALGGNPAWFRDDWAPLGDRPEAEAIAAYDGRAFKGDDSYDLIRKVITLRDQGNYQAAARYMKNFRWVAVAAEANGAYVDAQTLWQMAFTFARSGETEIAFDLMNRAARIAARLSFEGAGGADGGTLQLLERDRWRYLLFVDIAWAAVSGQAPQDMLVVSRY